MAKPPLGLEVAVRGLAVPPNRRQRRRSRFRKELGHSKWALVFDTETTTGLGQRLRVGWYQLYRGTRLQESGLFGDRDALDPEELALVEAYAAERGLEWLTPDAFAERVFLRCAGKRRRALIVGANLPFDISQLATGHWAARDRTGFMTGGFTFELSRDRRLPRVQVKRLGARATATRLTLPKGRSAEARNKAKGGNIQPHRGYFLDVLGPGAALFGQKLSLKGLADKLGTEHRKLDTDEHGQRISREYLEYLEQDVLVAWECAQALRERYQRFGFSQTPITQIYSEASIGKALLREACATPWLQVQHDLPKSVLAAILETYYGGRTECRIRRLAVPGIYLDFLSQYPTVFVLQQLDRYLFAQGFDWHDEDPTELQRLLEGITPGDVLDPTLWPNLDAICLVQPDGALVPTRARYRKTQAHGSSAPYNLALAYRHGGPPQWWTLADLIASVLESGRVPTLLRLLRFSPRARQAGLKPVDLNGDPRYRVDPSSEDLIKRLVELRQELKREGKAALQAGDHEHAQLLEGLSLGLKIEANAIAYGTPIEMNITEHRRPIDLMLELPDGDEYPCRNRRVETPGRWFNPLIATLVSSGGRLLLATAISLLHRQGGEYAMCDTDSLFAVATKTAGLIPCPGGPHRLPDEAIHSLSHDQVRQQLIKPFRPLNPYDGELGQRSILELEPENRDPATGAQIEIRCLSLAAKRYALFTLDEDGQPQLVGEPGKRRRSEHGLGHLLLPHDPDHPGASIDEFWEHLIATELGIEHPEPHYFGQPAIGRLSITSQPDQNAFKTYNRGKPYTHQVRPWGFLTIAHPHPLERARLGIRCLIGPYSRDLEELASQEWIDRGNPDRSYRLRLDDPYELSDRTIAAQTIRDYFDSYRHHTDPKMLGPDGDRCHPWTRGLLQHHHITATALIRIGKESNPLLDPDDPVPEDPTIEYRPRLCQGCGEPLTGRQDKWCSERCRKRSARRLVPIPPTGMTSADGLPPRS